MPPPVKFPVDLMLDSARALALAGGPMAASARGVSLATGASSGSIYHRFPRRDDLVAAAWLRAQDRFLADFLTVVGGGGADAGPDAAVRVFTWGVENRQDALLLLRFALRDLIRGEVSPTIDERAVANQAALTAALRGYAKRSGHTLSDVVLALVDLPYATTRRVLRDSADPDGAVVTDTVAALRRAARALLA
jgi:AcrR family transcriptional regulator